MPGHVDALLHTHDHPGFPFLCQAALAQKASIKADTRPICLQEAIVKRVDNVLGAILDLPLPPSSDTPSTAAAPTPLMTAVGFAHISDVADKRVDRLDKHLRVNSTARARVMGARPFEGLAVVSLKPSLVDRAIEGIRDLSPGA